jgi:zinc transport system ATP-binding protein
MPIADHTKNIIEVKNASFSYNGKEDVLQSITLAIHQGDFIGLVGPNGAGKTTLLKLMLGLLTPRQGTIELFSQNVQAFRAWHKIGYVPQKAVSFDANFPATVLEVVTMGRTTKQSLFKRTTQADEDAVRQSLENVEMWDFKDRLIGDLSGGQQQRVFIARSLVNQPEVIFLDEPTTGIDKKTQDGFYALLQKMNRELGLTLVLVSHDIERLVQEVMHIACVDKTLTCHVSPEEYLSENQTANINGRSIKLITHHHHN